jgi:geranylgeranyl pyrophosphate synthase
MLVLERYPEDNPVTRLFHNEDRQKNIGLAIELVSNSSIPGECYAVASDYCAKACHNLDLLPDNASRRSLITLAEYVVKRRK